MITVVNLELKEHFVADSFNNAWTEILDRQWGIEELEEERELIFEKELGISPNLFVHALGEDITYNLASNIERKLSDMLLNTVSLSEEEYETLVRSVGCLYIIVSEEL